jgi:hypothetical protein
MTNGRENRNHGNEEKGNQESSQEEKEVAAAFTQPGRASAPFVFLLRLTPLSELHCSPARRYMPSRPDVRIPKTKSKREASHRAPNTWSEIIRQLSSEHDELSVEFGSYPPKPGMCSFAT